MKKIISVCIFCMLAIFLSVSAFASSALFSFETFEGYDSRVGLEWTSQGAKDYTAIADTEKNKSAELVSTTAKMQELIKNFDKTSDDVKSIYVGFSIKLQDLNAKRSLLLKTSSLEANIIDIKNDGIIYVSDVSTGIGLEVGKWYDLSVEYSLVTGFVRLKVSNSENIFTSELFNRYKEQSGVTRVDFASWKSSGSDAVCLIDNCFAYSLSYDVSYYAVPTEVQDFENFESSPDGLTPPDGWQLKGTNEYTTALCSAGFESDKALELTNADGAHFEALYTAPSDIKSTATVEFDFKWKSGTTTYFDVCGKNSKGSSVSENYIGYFTYAGDVKVYKEKGGAATVINSSDEKLITDTWYHAVISLDLEGQSFSISLTNENGEISGTGIIPNEVTAFTGLCFYLKPASGRTSTLSIDNITSYQTLKTGVAGFAPAFSKIPVSENTVFIDISGKFTEDSLGDARVLVNGSEEGVTKSKNPGSIAITFDASNYNSLYFVELKNLVCDDGTVLNAATAYQTGDKWTISDFEFTKSSLSGGEIGASLKIYSECDEISDATLILALYNVKTGAMVDATCHSAELEAGTNCELECSLDVPERYEEYELIAYIWDSFNGMKILGKSKIIK
ncbi:MAG: hypothetical protein II998_06600 [Clostridia bacterium]|nr:hypothetical protein [Clostridia bacterium]